MTVLVTGGAGYIGSHMVHALVDAGERVVVLDNLSTGFDWSLPEGVPLVIGETGDQALVAALIAEHGIDAIIHFAASIVVPDSVADPLGYYRNNTMNSRALIETAIKGGVRRFIYASSASVYGVRDEADITEDMRLEPITLYSKYKADIEQVAFDAGSDRFTTVAVRNSTVCGYSPRMRLDLILSIFVMAALKKGVITIEGGTQLRPLIHMDDLVDLYVRLLDADHAAIHQQAFNISSDNYRVDAVARMVQAKLPCRLEFASFTDPRSYHVNTDKARSVLGYTTTRSIESAVDEIKDALDRGLIQETDPRCYNIRHVKHLLEATPGEIFFSGGAEVSAS